MCIHLQCKKMPVALLKTPNVNTYLERLINVGGKKAMTSENKAKKLKRSRSV